MMQKARLTRTIAMSVFRRVFFLLVFVCVSAAPASCYAWSNYFRFVNNFNFPLVLSINPTTSSVNNECGGGTTGVEVGSRSMSCKFEFQTETFHRPSNEGTITIAKKSDPSSYCVFPYSYTLSIFSYFDMRSEVFSEPTCYGDLTSKEFSVVNDHNQALPRPLVGDVILGMDQGNSYKFTQSLSEADCGGKGGDNCIIASPDLTSSYLSNGSTLQESIVLQNELARYEPLNFEQLLGSHNAAISAYYTGSQSNYNMSHGDPDNYLPLTDQLNAGLRQIELDIEWYKDAITVCHNHISKNLGWVLCDDDFPLQGDGKNPRSAFLNEIKSWIEKNPHAFVIIYLDANLPITGHVAELDTALSLLEPYIFTPAMAAQYYHVIGNTLPTSRLTQDDLVHRFKKNIIVTNDNNVDDIKTSRYVFTNIENINLPPLEEDGVDTFLQSNYSFCGDAGKYSNVKNLFSDDPLHYNLLRINADRTTINYISCVGSKDADRCVDYYTTQNIPNFLNCPLNIFSTNMFGFTCDANSCNHHPTDPRLYSFLWSWDLGYPLTKTNGSDVAYINPNTGHFQNAPLVLNNVYSVLCVRSVQQQTPIAPLPWYLETMTITDLKNVYSAAQAVCARSGGSFAVPVTSYWLNDALNLINPQGKINPYNVLVNYENLAGEWTPNVTNLKRGRSLVMKKT